MGSSLKPLYLRLSETFLLEICSLYLRTFMAELQSPVIREPEDRSRTGESVWGVEAWDRDTGLEGSSLGLR